MEQVQTLIIGYMILMGTSTEGLGWIHYGSPGARWEPQEPQPMESQREGPGARFWTPPLCQIW